MNPDLIHRILTLGQEMRDDIRPADDETGLGAKWDALMNAMNTYIVAPTKERAESDDEVEVTAFDEMTAVSEYERCIGHAWQDGIRESFLWVREKGARCATCIDTETREIKTQ